MEAYISNVEVIMIAKLILAAAFGAIIGFQRERDKKSAGLKTRTLVCLGAAFLTIISIYLAGEFSNVDTSRIISAVVMGIGFIGGGAIMQDSSGVKGVTTAASIWAVAAIGIAVGSGMYIVASAATIMTFIVLHTFSAFERRYFPSNKKRK